MAGKLNADAVLAEADQIIKVWEANTTFALGDVTLSTFKRAEADLAKAVDTMATIETQLTGLKIAREENARALHELCSRARSGFRAVYGPDSTQYEQAGGTRSSDRRRPVRKPQSSRRRHRFGRVGARRCPLIVRDQS